MLLKKLEALEQDTHRKMPKYLREYSTPVIQQASPREAPGKLTGSK
jgi:hypothetical protein